MTSVPASLAASPLDAVEVMGPEQETSPSSNAAVVRKLGRAV